MSAFVPSTSPISDPAPTDTRALTLHREVLLATDEAREIAKRLPPPFMFSYESSGERAGAGLTLRELGALGYRVLSVANTAVAFHRAMQQTYESLARGAANPVMAGTTNKAEQAALHRTIGFDALIAIEKVTVEK